jgi:hypothetical protein
MYVFVCGIALSIIFSTAALAPAGSSGIGRGLFRVFDRLDAVIVRWMCRNR